MTQRILTGVQPTGQLHLGNYLGAIRNWRGFLDSHECLFFIVDLHAITIPQDPQELRNNTRKVAAAYIASGMSPEKCSIFAQSHVPQHAELAWVLGCATPLGWLNRMTQFKDKAGKQKDQASLGLLSYPVLMAADILLYKATHVPVGADQKQHLELTRDIAQSFNSHYGKQVFIQPEPFIVNSVARIMSLRDGTKKMSKSDPSDQSRINLDDTPDIIKDKIKRAKTDMDLLPGTSEGLELRPEACNLLELYAALSGKTLDQTCAYFEGSQFSALKNELSDAIIAELDPIREEMTRLQKDVDYLDKLLYKGAEKARVIAKETLAQVYDTMGFLI
jgi:tryptophanyl-tRNA synthetase